MGRSRSHSQACSRRRQSHQASELASPSSGMRKRSRSASIAPKTPAPRCSVRRLPTRALASPQVGDASRAMKATTPARSSAASASRQPATTASVTSRPRRSRTAAVPASTSAPVPVRWIGDSRHAETGEALGADRRELEVRTLAPQDAERVGPVTVVAHRAPERAGADTDRHLASDQLGHAHLRIRPAAPRRAHCSVCTRHGRRLGNKPAEDLPARREDRRAPHRPHVVPTRSATRRQRRAARRRRPRRDRRVRVRVARGSRSPRAGQRLPLAVAGLALAARGVTRRAGLPADAPGGPRRRGDSARRVRVRGHRRDLLARLDPGGTRRGARGGRGTLGGRRRTSRLRGPAAGRAGIGLHGRGSPVSGLHAVPPPVASIGGADRAGAGPARPAGVAADTLG